MACCKRTTPVKRQSTDLLRPIVCLTKAQRHLVVKTWLNIDDRRVFLQMTLLRMFNRLPDAQGCFRFASCAEADLRKNEQFRLQCAAMTEFLDYMVGFVYLNSGNFIEDACRIIGRRHAERSRRQIQDWYWSEFVDCFMTCLAPSLLISKLPVMRQITASRAQHAWRAFLDWVLRLMRDGYEEYRRRPQDGVKGRGVTDPEQDRILFDTQVAEWIERSLESLCDADEEISSDSCASSRECQSKKSSDTDSQHDKLPIVGVVNLSTLESWSSQATEHLNFPRECR